MQQIFTGLAFIFAAFYPLLLERIMSSVPEIITRCIFFVVVLIGVGLILTSNPIYPAITNLRTHFFKSLLIISITISLIGFAGWWIFWGQDTKVKLEIISYTQISTYPPNTTLAGIQWKSVYGELDVMISNPSEFEIRDIDLLIKPDQPVARIGQESKFRNVSFEPIHSSFIKLAQVSPENKLYTVPLELIATNAGYKIFCRSLPPKRMVIIKMATVNLPNNETIKNPLDKAYVLPITAKDASFSNWYGYPDKPDNTFLLPINTKKVFIHGTYFVKNTRNEISIEVDAVDILSRAAEQAKQKMDMKGVGKR